MPFFLADCIGRDLAFLGTSITATATYVNEAEADVRLVQPFYSLQTVSNLAVGGSTSWFGLARLENVLLPLAPDVVIFEYVVNDDLTSFYARTEEAVIRRIRALLPEARIVFVATPRVADPDIDDPTDVDDAVKQQWFTLCDRYGVLKVDWSARLAALVNGGAHLNVYMSDTVHPTATGHASIADLLVPTLNAAMGSGMMPDLPERLYDCAAFEDSPVWRDGPDNDGETGTWTTNGDYRESSAAGSTIEWDFSGVSFGFETGAAAGVLAVSVDGGDETQFDLALYGSAINWKSILADTTHTAVFRVVSGTVQMEEFISI